MEKKKRRDRSELVRSMCLIGRQTNPPLRNCVTRACKTAEGHHAKAAWPSCFIRLPASLLWPLEGCQRDNYSPQTELATPGSHSNR